MTKSKSNVFVLPSNDLHYMSVVVAQLLKESFPILEVCGSNPVKCRFLYRTCF